MQHLETRHIIYLTLSVGQESGHSLAGSSAQHLSQAAITVSAAAGVSSEDSGQAGCASQLT